MIDPGDGRTVPNKQKLSSASRFGETVLVPGGKGHSVRAARGGGAVAGDVRGEAGLAVWYYVHACPSGLFHLHIGFLSGAGWQQLYEPTAGTRKGWVLEHGVPKM